MQTCKTARRHRSCCGHRRHSRHHDIGRGLYDCPVCRRQVLCFRVSRQRTTTVRGATPIASATPPMVLLNGETLTEYSDIYPGSTVENIKTGSSLTVCRKTADGGRMSAKYGRTSEKAICALLKSLYPILPRRSHNE